MLINDQIAQNEELIGLLTDYLPEAGKMVDVVLFEIESLRAEIDLLKLTKKQYRDDIILNRPMELLRGALAAAEGCADCRPEAQIRRTALLGDQAAGEIQGVIDVRRKALQEIESV